MKMNNVTPIRLCPVCNKGIRIYALQAYVQNHQRKTFYYLNCDHCGYGLSEAFNTIEEALHHWNYNEVLQNYYS